MLGALEALALRSAPPDRDDLDRLTAMDVELADTEDAVARWHRDSAFHQALAEGCPNHYLRELINTARINLSRYEIEYMRRVGSRDRSVGEHRAVLAALRAGDRDRATGLVETHWRSGLNMVLAWLPG